MSERGEDLDLAQEAVDADAEADLGAHDLDGDATLMPGVGGEVDDRHPAPPQLPFDRVASLQHAAQTVQQASRRRVTPWRRVPVR